MIDDDTLSKAVHENVTAALHEDIGDKDITAELIPSHQQANAYVISRESTVLCGTVWADKVFALVDNALEVKWLAKDGDHLAQNQRFLELSGPARSILTAERCALNFIQTMSATATRSRRYVELVAHTQVKLLDTRKTIPGLRIAQKYAVATGGCYNHRIGLYDAFLIKENHIISCGSIDSAVSQARRIAPGKKVEVEVESIAELEQALSAKSDIIMLDNFSLENLRLAVEITQQQAKLEASGNITSDTLIPVAETGVDYISIGALTKDIKAIDLSMRFS